MPTADEVRLPPSLAREYQLLGELGRGSFGRVLHARHREQGVEVAVKVLDARSATPEAAARLRREAELTARVRHPHVVRVFGHGHDALDGYYIVYEYVPGCDLESLVRAGQRPPTERLASWGAAVADALAAVHAAGMVHRDVKPANVLLRGGSHPLLCDLGVARDEGGRSRLTQEGMILGTVAYMAPEVLVGRAGPAADQYAWAASLFELHFGCLVHPTRDPREILERLGRRLPAVFPPSERGRAPELEAVLRRALAPEPGARYPDCGALARALGGEEAAGSASSGRDTRVVGETRTTREVAPAGAAPRPPSGASLADGVSSSARTARFSSLSSIAVKRPVSGPQASSRGRQVAGAALLLALGLGALLWSGGGEREAPEDRGSGTGSAPASPVATTDPPAAEVRLRQRERLVEILRELHPEPPRDRIHVYTYYAKGIDDTPMEEAVHAFVDHPEVLGDPGTPRRLEEAVLALQVWLGALAGWELEQGDGSSCLRDPVVLATLDEQVFGRLVNFLELVYLADAPVALRVTEGDLQAATMASRLQTLARGGRATLVSVLDSLVVELDRPLARVRLALAAHLTGTFLGKYSDPPPEDVALVRRLFSRLTRAFLEGPADDPSTYWAGKALAYLHMNVFDHAILDWDTRRQAMDRVARDLLDEERWPPSVERLRLRLRYLQEGVRLHRFEEAKDASRRDEPGIAPYRELARALRRERRRPVVPAGAGWIRQGANVAYLMARYSGAVPYGEENPDWMHDLKMDCWRLR